MTARVNLLARVWYRRTGETAVDCSLDLVGDVARLVPYRWRRFHGVVAVLFGYFWRPCVLCDRPFGGHESGKSIPDPTEPHSEILVCSECSRRMP